MLRPTLTVWRFVLNRHVHAVFPGNAPVVDDRAKRLIAQTTRLRDDRSLYTKSRRVHAVFPGIKPVVDDPAKRSISVAASRTGRSPQRPGYALILQSLPPVHPERVQANRRANGVLEDC